MKTHRIGKDGWLLLLVMAWLAVTLGVRPLALPDEGRYVGVSWEMVTSGNWLVPTLNSLPFFHKPPLFYWITAASLEWLGPHVWASRIASLIAAGVTVFTLYGFALRQKGRALARWAMLILATQPFFFAGAQFANLDMLVASMISASILLAAEAAIELEHGKPYRGRLAAAYVFAALGVLAKGLIGIVLPAMVIFVWLAWNRRLARLAKLIWLPGLILFALICGSWLLAMQDRYPDFLNYFFVYNQFERFAEKGFNNPMPFWFYLPVILVLTLPWSLAIPVVWKQLKLKPEQERKPTPLSLMVIWIITITGFFSIPSSKLVGYILPVLSPLAYLIACGLRERWADPAGIRRLKAFSATGIVFCLAALVANNIFNTKTDKGLSRLIAAQYKTGDQVVFVNEQYFDLPFYLRLKAPVKIVDDWKSSLASGKDNWQKVMTDAARFDPTQAKDVLRSPSQLSGILCSQPVSWVIAPNGSVHEYPLLGKLTPFATHESTVVWRITRGEIDSMGVCPQMPSDGQ
jgi:4-amino-4-deoxy-L-arabinose transferase-like glycosyltransferase